MTPLAQRLARELMNNKFEGREDKIFQERASTALRGGHFFDVTNAIPLFPAVEGAFRQRAYEGFQAVAFHRRAHARPRALLDEPRQGPRLDRDTPGSDQATRHLRRRGTLGRYYRPTCAALLSPTHPHSVIRQADLCNRSLARRSGTWHQTINLCRGAMKLL
jgi:hypothetical protein